MFGIESRPEKNTKMKGTHAVNLFMTALAPMRDKNIPMEFHMNRTRLPALKPNILPVRAAGIQ